MTTPRIPEPELMDLAEEAKAYAAADFAAVNQAFVDCLLKVVGPAAQPSLLDLGTGPGDIPLRIATARPNWNICAVDAAASMIDLARAAVAASPAKHITLVCADAKATGLPPASFDIICSNSLLHHMPDPHPLWLEIKRLARPGATIFLRDLFRPASPRIAAQIVAQYAGTETPLLQEEFRRSLLAAFTPEEITAQLRRAGLENLRVVKASDRHVDIMGKI